MEIKQIVAAHVEQGSDPAIIGLGTDGVLYEWLFAQEPRVHTQPVHRPATEQEMKDKPYHGVTRQVFEADGVTAKYEQVYTDGRSAGWKSLGCEMSKTIIHPDDPTKNERS